jgi:mannose-1-phosphate guanylyltransferase/mannose-6-phosphate isomerase
MRFVRRTWGRYLTLLSRERFKLKLLHFLAGKSCSMQRHHARSELWLCLYGDGIMDGDTRNSYGITKGNWGLVDTGRWHRFTAVKPTLILEVQFGARCEEDDIERKDA